MTGWAIEALAATSVLMLLVLALRGAVAARFGAHASYLLWLLPASRMILPRLPQAAAPIHPAPIHFDIAALVRAGTMHPATAQATAASTPNTIDWMIILLIVWLGGALCYLAWQLAGHRRFMRLALGQACGGHRRGGIWIGRSAGVAGPLAAGIVHRRILLPTDFARRYTGREQRLALAHELAHHRRGDLIANAAALVMLAFHWFNPIAHWAYRAFRADQEMACDATVLGRAPAAARPDYGSALIKSARAGSTAACALGPATPLKRRMIMITRPITSRARRLAGMGLATILTVAGLGLTASGSNAAPSPILTNSVQPLAVAAPRERTTVVIDRDGTRRETHSYASNSADDRAMPLPPLPPLPPTAPSEPAAALPPLPPVPPAPPELSATQIKAMDLAARQAGASAREAADNARRAIADIDYAAISRQAMAQARAELARACRNAPAGPANESDAAAIARLSAGCVDIAEINKQVEDALREATDEIRRSTDLSQADRARALAAIDRAHPNSARRTR